MNTTKVKAFAAVFATFLAFSGVAAAQSTTHILETGTLTEEKVWGSSNDQLTGSEVLDVEVTQTDEMVNFHAETSFIDGQSGETLAVDAESDGYSSYQVQYRNGEWKIAYMENSQFQSWESLPSEFDAELSQGEFAVSVPVSNLEKEGKSFKYGLQVNTENGNQILYPEGDGLWYNGNNYITSEKYKSSELDYFDTDTNTQSVFSPSDFVNQLESFFQQQSNFIKDWVRSNFASKETVEEEQEEQNELEQRIEELEVETQVQEQTIKNLAEETGVEEGEALSTAQDVMLENDIDELTVEEDGTTWSCKRQVSRYGVEDAVCVSQVE